MININISPKLCIMSVNWQWFSIGNLGYRYDILTIYQFLNDVFVLYDNVEQRTPEESDI